ncbi:FACT complex subunit spt16 [Vanrija albida]|uniref:FACT complex subunit n=1 Tax=Vanrija albida TaxID=181172 RepID=A0ABR3Q7A1_9TREE
MTDVKLDSDVFFRRAEKIFSAWEKPTQDTAELKDVQALQIFLGDATDDAPAFTKSAALQTYLLAFEFPSTLIIFWKSSRKVTFVCSSSKAKILRQLQSQNGIEIDIRVRAPKDESTASVIPDLVLELGDSKVGNLPKDKATGKLADEWNKAIATSKAGIEFVDVAVAVSAILADKDNEEIKATVTAARLTSTCMQHYFKSKMEALIDRETKITHENFSQLVEEKIGNDVKGADMKLWNKNPQLGEVDFTNTDWVYSPIIQSGGDYDLKVSAYSNENNLKPGVILSSLGIRYKSYCASMARTFMINPSPKQERNFEILIDARLSIVKLLKEGAVVKDVYAAAQAIFAERGLGDNFVKNIGFATGLEYRDSTFLLSPKNDRKLQENMILVVSLGLQGLSDKQGAYALQLSDTVKVGVETGAFLTEGCAKLRDVVMDLGDSEPEVEEPKPSKASKPIKKTNGASNGKAPRSPVKARSSAAGGTKQTRGAQREQIESTTAQRIKAHQAELHAQRQAEGLKKWANGSGANDGSRDKVVKRYESYRREEQLPSIVQERRIYVDEQRQSIILPINGFATPFHISTVKNATKVEENAHIVLRINFQSPGQIAGKKEDMPFEDPDATFIRSLTFRSKDQRHLIKVFEQISGLKKAATKREAERKEMADVIEQEKLVEIKGRHPYVLKNVFPRPATEGKKSDGNLEIHQNGLRFRPDGPGQRIDLLFSNMKHLFFQPSEKELVVLLHVHLKAPIMIGKKKTWDVQFFREVSDMNFDETTGKRRKARYGDEDEIEQEQEDRRRRQELDKMFHSFAKRVSDAAQAQQYELEVDVPYRELGFFGVPHRTNVMLQPTTDCLVHLSEMPFTVITLSEVQIVHFERVQFGLKAFDMVFVFNDFKKSPVAINSIPVIHLDNVKEWLDSVDIPISEGPVNLTWPAIMKTINDDPYEFYKEGGWAFLTGGGDSDDEDESSEGSVFEESGDGFDGSSDDDDSESDDYSDDDSASDDSGSGADSDESGESWDELERKAKKADDKRRQEGGDLSDSEKKKKGGRR